MHSRTTRTLTGLAAAATLLLASGPADAASADTPVTIPAGTTTITVAGHGWGHGHGMSQYGAKGAAEAGQSYQQILGFYYPGTTLAPAAGKVRVLVTADNDNNLKIAQAPRLRVHDLGNGRTYKLRKHARAWRLKSVAGQTRVYFKTGHWHLYKTGGRKALAGDGEFKSSANQLTLKLPTGSRVYRGKLRFTNSDTVNVVRLESYLRGVIPSEMPAAWPLEALKSQAVAARTYAARERADHATRYYDLCDTAACQVYGGVASEQAQSSAAADGTAGQTLVYGGQYAFAQFSSSNGGWTSYGGQPYLPAQPDPNEKPYDPVTKTGSPYYNWTQQVSLAQLQAKYPQLATITTITVSGREGGTDGWVTTVDVSDGTQTVQLKGTDFKALYALRSSYFSLTTP